MPDRSGDWMNQAERNLNHAVRSMSDGQFEWSCFAAQQAAKMAIRGLYQSPGPEGWAHNLRRLLEELKQAVAVPDRVFDVAFILDGYYIPTRYPNGHAVGAPGENYNRLQSEEAIDHARTILEFCRLQMAQA